MCRKDFTGYKCGHCSLPTTTPCPLTWSNPLFPLCKYVAEFAIQLDSYCEPCHRIAFTHDVLLKEKLHTEAHQTHSCNCGFDYTEEERERRRTAKLGKEKAGYRVFDQLEKQEVRRMGQFKFPAQKQSREFYAWSNSKQNGSQRQDEKPHQRSLEQYMNAPYGRHPALQPPAQQSFRPYQPLHSYVGIFDSTSTPLPPPNHYSGNYSPFQLPTDTTMETDLTRNISAPHTISPEKERIPIPEQISAKESHANQGEDRGFSRLQVTGSAFRGNGESLFDILSPADISSALFSAPSAPQIFPMTHERVKSWDTKSL